MEARHNSSVSECREILKQEYLTTLKASTLLRVSKRTIFNLVKRGELQAIKLSHRITLIPIETLLSMVNQKEYKHISVFAKERNKSPKVKTKPSKPRAKTTADDYKQSVKGSFMENIEEEVYTMAEICSKFNYTYGRFYNLRMRYHIPCTKGQATKCFPKAIIDRVMQEEAERLGRQQTDHWYTCFDIMEQFGLGKTQVRRFALTYKVRIKKRGHTNLYLKADWDAAREKAAKTSASVKAKRATKV